MEWFHLILLQWKIRTKQWIHHVSNLDMMRINETSRILITYVSIEPRLSLIRKSWWFKRSAWLRTTYGNVAHFFLTYTCAKRSTVSKRKTLFLKSSVLRTFICHDCHILSSRRKSRMCCDFGGRTEGKLAASRCAVDARWEERDPVHHVCTDMTCLTTWRFCFLAPTGDAALFKGSCET